MKNVPFPKVPGSEIEPGTCGNGTDYLVPITYGCPYVSKRILFLMGVVFLIWSGVYQNLSLGTVKPSLESLVEDSTWVVVGSVTEVQQLDTGQRIVTIEPHDLLKGRFVNTWTKQLTFLYQAAGDKEFVLDFDAMKRSGDKCIFMLQTVPDVPTWIKTLHVELTDTWFGIEKATPEMIQEIRSMVQP